MLQSEAAKLNELFLWKNGEKAEQELDNELLKGELTGMFSFAFLTADNNGLETKQNVKNEANC
jgi:hypothetical protein